MASVAPINPAGPIHSPGNCCPSTPASSSSAGLSSRSSPRRSAAWTRVQPPSPKGGTHPSRRSCTSPIRSSPFTGSTKRREPSSRHRRSPHPAPPPSSRIRRRKPPPNRSFATSTARIPAWPGSGGEELGDNTSNAGQLYDTHSYNGTTVHVFNVRGPVRVQFLREDYSGTNLTLPQLESEARQRNLVMWETTVDRDSTITLPSQYGNGYINLLGGSAVAYVV